MIDFKSDSFGVAKPVSVIYLSGQSISCKCDYSTLHEIRLCKKEGRDKQKENYNADSIYFSIHNYVELRIRVRTQKTKKGLPEESPFLSKEFRLLVPPHMRSEV